MKHTYVILTAMNENKLKEYGAKVFLCLLHMIVK